MTGNEIAPKGKVFVCFACGKRSIDKYGDRAIDKGWDVSCMLNSGLYNESQLVMKDDRVVEIKDEV